MNQIEIQDDVFFSSVFELGTSEGFDYSRQVVISRHYRPALILSLLKFKQIFLVFEASGLQVEEVKIGNTMDSLELREGDEFPLYLLAAQLIQLGYTRQKKAKSPGEFAILGGQVQIWPKEAPAPVQIEFFGDTIEEIRGAGVGERVDAGVDTSVDEGVEAGVDEGAGIDTGAGVGTDSSPRKDFAQTAPENSSGRQPQTLVSDSTPGKDFAQTAPENSSGTLVSDSTPGKDCVETALENSSGTLVSDSTPGKDCVETAPMGPTVGTPHAHPASSTVRVEVSGGSCEVASIVVNAFRSPVISASNSGQYTPAGNLAQGKIEEMLKSADVYNSLFLLLDPDQFSEGVAAEFLAAVQILQARDIPAVSVSAVGAAASEITVCESALFAEFERSLEGTALGEYLESALDPPKRSTKRARDQKPKRDALKVEDLSIGDFLVHDLHGVGKYVGQESREGEQYLVVEYGSGSRRAGAEPDFLFVPAQNLENLAPYIGHDRPRLSRFGGVDFAKVKARTRKHAQEVALKLVEIYARRLAANGTQYFPDDLQTQQFDESFGFELTPDQSEAIEAVKADMEASCPMDRLICGDVGFGKTEVALRAAFKAVQTGKQVAILVPTTILAQQHFQTFSKRMAPFGVNTQLLNRFVTAGQRRKVIADAASGALDILIGTHALLTPKLQFRDLGLLVVDEEQRFGSMHKEMLKALNLSVDVLSMSATPIPRTLEMALTGVRDISAIQTPPPGRLPIRTNVLESSDRLLQDALLSELDRKGQVFLIHNNIATISQRAARIRELVPAARVATAHGRMSEARIDRIIDDFWTKQIDILVCTTIVETGLDIPNANTLIVDKAEKYGLSQLHQLRGRVGRSGVQAYAYLFYTPGKPLTDLAYKRLETIQDFNELGAGTAIALKDLEIRGAGDFLGAEQSGHIAGVGYNMYVQMMSDAVEILKSGAN